MWICSGKTFSWGVLDRLKPSEGFIFRSLISFRANLWPNSVGLVSLSAYWRSMIEYSLGCGSPSPYLSVRGSKLLTEWLLGSFRALTAYRRYLLSNKGITGVILTFFSRGLIGVLFKASVMVLVCRLTIFWISWA
jgi:hypothetical protein